MTKKRRQNSPLSNNETIIGSTKEQKSVWTKTSTAVNVLSSVVIGMKVATTARTSGTTHCTQLSCFLLLSVLFLESVYSVTIV